MVINDIICIHMPVDLFLQSQLLLIHLSVAHANRVLEGVNVLQLFLLLCQSFHRLSHLQKEGKLHVSLCFNDEYLTRDLKYMPHDHILWKMRTV